MESVKQSIIKGIRKYVGHIEMGFNISVFKYCDKDISSINLDDLSIIELYTILNEYKIFLLLNDVKSLNSSYNTYQVKNSYSNENTDHIGDTRHLEIIDCLIQFATRFIDEGIMMENKKLQKEIENLKIANKEYEYHLDRLMNIIVKSIVSNKTNIKLIVVKSMEMKVHKSE